MYPPPPSSLLPFLDSARANAASVSLRIFASARSYRLDGRETGRDRCTRNAAAPKFQKPRDQPHPSSIATHGLDIPSFKSCPPKKPIITCRRADRSFRIPPSRMPTIMLVIFFIDFVEYVTLSSSFDDSFAPIEIETEVYYRMIILKFFLLFLFQRIVIYILEKRVFERSIFFFPR